jgi:hypothetical protein
MEIFFAATLLIVMIVIIERALQVKQTSLCQQEVRITERPARKK